MKKLFLLSIMICTCLVQALADEWTDANGVTWSFTISGSNATITGATGFGSTLVVPGTVNKNGTNYTVTGIGGSAFKENKTIEHVQLPATVTSIGSSGFEYCTNLQDINLSSCKVIEWFAFYGCSDLSQIGDLMSCQTIGNSAFYSCYSLSEVQISSNHLTSIGSSNFQNTVFVRISTSMPPSLASSFNSGCTVIVPASLLAAYQGANGWSDLGLRILPDNVQTDYNVTVEALEKSSGIHAAIGEENLNHVINLKVSGSINGYDIMIIRNKMDNLHTLDLEDANIVANDYEYYTGYHTSDNILGGYAFYSLSKLKSLKLPRTLKSIGDYALYCTSLGSIVIPEGVESIGQWAFNNCHHLSSVAFPNTLLTIKVYAFGACDNLKKISLPTSIKSIERNAFIGCGSLSEVRIPSSITSIGSSAFSNCSSLKDIYTYTPQPTSIDQTTFGGLYATATLHIPTASLTSLENPYYWDTEWSQFRTKVAFDEPYEYFYLKDDMTMGEDSERIDGSPDADVNPGGGLIVEGGEDQNLDDLHIIDDGNQSGSVIGNGNISVNGLYFDIQVQANRWYFFHFPYQVKIADIVCDGSWVFRRYDGDYRAAHGSGGWQDLRAEEKHLVPGHGYIFQTNKSGTLQIPVNKSHLNNMKADDIVFDLIAYPSDANRPQDASWNFTGNPYTSYYDMDYLNYDAPITVWNGTSYEAIRPGEDDYHFRPFEAFFVQKPSDINDMGYDKEHRETYKQKERAQTQASARRAMSADRQLVNLTLSDGQLTDKTRVVFTTKRTADYEIGHDAAKFMSNSVPQLYTLDGKGVSYAINERPEGEVALGYQAVTKGELTIGVTRMDMPMLLRDNVTGATFDLTNGDYTFSTEAGTFNKRFVLVKNGNITGVADIQKKTGVSLLPTSNGINVNGAEGKTVEVYSANGMLMRQQTGNGLLNIPAGVYVVKVEDMTVKMMVR